MRATIEILKKLRNATGLKVNRNFNGFFADRLARAFNCPTLTDAIEDLAQSLNCSVEYIGSENLKAFLQEATGDKGPSIMQWCREHPKLTAMLACLKTGEELGEYLAMIEMPEISEGDTGTVGEAPQYQIPIIAKIETGLAHGSDKKAGNATLYRRRAVITDTGKHLFLPVFAGNSLRGAMRDLLADHFLKLIGLTASRSKPQIELWLFHVLYSGGVLESGGGKADAALGKSGATKTEGLRNIRDNIPMLSVLGSAIGNRVIQGRICVGDLRPGCIEWGGGELPANELFGWEFLTRRDDYEGRNDDDGTSAMIAETEILKPGVILFGGIDIDTHANDLDRSCLHQGLSLLRNNGRLGAENRRGLGKVTIGFNADLDPSIYLNHLMDNKEDILDYIRSIGGLAD